MTSSCLERGPGRSRDSVLCWRCLELITTYAESKCSAQGYVVRCGPGGLLRICTAQQLHVATLMQWGLSPLMSREVVVSLVVVKIIIVVVVVVGVVGLLFLGSSL